MLSVTVITEYFCELFKHSCTHMGF